jgi:two-component system, chemotaxis family, chemotaxis protein CheY
MTASKRGAVLVVDDDADIRDAVEESLSDAGYAVVTAAGGVEALALLPGLPRPCVVLLDWMMPGMTGGEFLLRAQESGALAGIPVLLFTASRRPEVPPGVAEVISKPIDLDALLDFVARHCRA